MQKAPSGAFLVCLKMHKCDSTANPVSIRITCLKKSLIDSNGYFLDYKKKTL